MPDTISVVLVKSFTYRGAPEEWSNKYHLTGANPNSNAEWDSISDGVLAAEAAGLVNTINYVRVIGYDAGNKVAVYTREIAQPPPVYNKGQLVLPNGMYQAPGDVALTVRWRTNERNSRGKPIYLRKYFHGAIMEGALDKPWQTQLTTIGSNMQILATGVGPNASRRVCGPQGASAGEVFVTPWTTVRTLKRRGKNPTRG